jgi:ubiquitin carboxyl-terminal hydrolase 9/24
MDVTGICVAQRMFAHLELSRSPCYSPEDFWAAFKDYDGEPVNVREHEDAYEFFTRLQVTSRHCQGWDI